MEALGIIILAAGKGTRMKSDLPKVLHRVGNTCMVNHVIAAAGQLTRNHIHVVVGHQAEKVRRAVSEQFDVNFSLQRQLLGTGDAVKAALPALDGEVADVLVLCGDVPLIQVKTLSDLVLVHRQHQAKVSVLAVEVAEPSGYGRVIMDADGSITAIREEADASNAEKKIKIVNTGIYCFDKLFLQQAVDAIRPDNRQAEYYLTDAVDIAVRNKEKTLVQTMADPHQVIGVNTLEELAKAEDLIHRITG